MSEACHPHVPVQISRAKVLQKCFAIFANLLVAIVKSETFQYGQLYLKCSFHGIRKLLYIGMLLPQWNYHPFNTSIFPIHMYCLYVFFVCVFPDTIPLLADSSTALKFIMPHTHN